MTSNSRDAWTREFGTHERTLKGKTYRNLVQFIRPCATQGCGSRFSIYVTQAVADGHKSNNNFGLKNCELHRNGTADREELAALRLYKHTTAAELTELYGRNKALFEELQVYKAKLATYDLPAMMLNEKTLEDAMVAFKTDPTLTIKPIGCEPVQNTKSSSVAFPWEKT